MSHPPPKEEKLIEFTLEKNNFPIFFLGAKDDKNCQIFLSRVTP